MSRRESWLPGWIKGQRANSSKQNKTVGKKEIVIDLLDSSDDENTATTNKSKMKQQKPKAVDSSASLKPAAFKVAATKAQCKTPFSDASFEQTSALSKPAAAKQANVQQKIPMAATKKESVKQKIHTSASKASTAEFFSAEKPTAKQTPSAAAPAATATTTTTANQASASPSHLFTPLPKDTTCTPQKKGAITKSTSATDASPTIEEAFHSALLAASGFPQLAVVNTVIPKRKRRKRLQESKHAESGDHKASDSSTRKIAPNTTKSLGESSENSPTIPPRPKTSYGRNNNKTGPASSQVDQHNAHASAAAAKPLASRNNASSKDDLLLLATSTRPRTKSHSPSCAEKQKASSSSLPRSANGINSCPSSSIPSSESTLSTQSRAAVAHQELSSAEEVDGMMNSNAVQIQRVPTTADLAKQCWKCAVDLKMPEGQFCVYYLHPHLLLKVPVCSVCSEEVAAVELNETSDDDATTYCAGCAASEEDVDTFLLCDNNNNNNGDGACRRAFCIECVAKAHGGGSAGVGIVQNLLQDDDSEWLCPVCNPPAELVQLQEQFAQDLSDREQTKLTRDEIIVELQYAEEQKQKCEDELNRDIEEIASEFRQELLSENAFLAVGPELEELVREEVSLWQEKWQLHDQRVSDFISILQDELELEHHITPAICYEQYLEQSAIRRRDCDDESSDEEEEEWQKAAAKMISKREKEEKKARKNEALPPTLTDITFQDVEDLATELKSDGDDDDDFSMLRSGFYSQNRRRPTKAEYEEAMQNEEEQKVRIKKIVDEEKDVEDTVEEKRQVVRRSSSKVVRSEYERIRAQSTRKQSGGQNRSSVRACSNKRSLTKMATEEAVSTPHSSGGSSRAKGDSSSSKKSKAVKNLTFSLDAAAGEDNLESILGGSPSPVAASAPLVLCDPAIENEQGKRAVRKVSVPEQLAKKLKPHQIAGVKFMWRNCFSDFESHTEGDSTKSGGCILAHNMGLGKSLSTIALIHTVMTDPSMVSSAKESKDAPFIQCVLILAPVNTLVNWEQEFYKWLDNPCTVYNLASVERSSRNSVMKKWSERGGVMLMSDQAFLRVGRDGEDAINCDLIILDEAHTMLKNTKNKVFEALSAVKTPRRIALTGSPFQNNLIEYFTMINFVRKNIFGYSSEARFEAEYVTKIQAGMPSDASPRAQYESLEMSSKLNQLLEPYVQRVDASELRRDLPSMQQVVLHVRQSRLQGKLYRRFKSKQKLDDALKNFFTHYSELRPIHNHPASLLFPNSKAQKSSNRADEIATADKDWWKATCEREGLEQVKSVMNGYKIVLLLHILAYAEKINDKVLIFANSLSTLNYIEYVLSLEDWSEHVPSLAAKFPGMKLGGWQKSKDYLRIDGGVQAGERGDMIDQFNANDVDGGFKAFLLASRSGGIGINLTAANRVVIVDDHFNPTVATQSIFRAYRYGQDKKVFVYRLLTQGTMEERVYGRIVNKTGVALRVIDKKSIKRSFTKAEVEGLMQNLTWVQCDRCEKWRVLIGGEEEEKELPKLWYCEMNANDSINNTCDASEKEQLWYERKFFSGESEGDDKLSTPLKVVSKSAELASPSKPVENDELLKHLLDLKNGKTLLISKHYYHETLLEAKQSDVELEEARRELEREEKEATARASMEQLATASAPASEESDSSGSIPETSSRVPVSLAETVQNVTDDSAKAPIQAISSPTTPLARKRSIENADKKPPAQDRRSPMSDKKGKKSQDIGSPSVVEEVSTDESSASGKQGEGSENPYKKARKSPLAAPSSAGQGNDDVIDLCSSDDDSALL